MARKKGRKSELAMNRHKTWTCPFFLWDGKKEISCEGGRICFHTSHSANDYMNAYCAGGNNWQQCTVAKALLKYYDEEENYGQEKTNTQRG